jgi:predicted transcriptional regulator
MKDKIYRIRLSSDYKQKLSEIAKESNSSISNIIRDALFSKYGIKEHKNDNERNG